MSTQAIAKALLERAGTSYAAEAGIHLADKPAPLYQLLVLAHLVSARISADIAVAATRELVTSGYRTPQRIADADWQELVDALGRARYKRYDESTASRLGANAAILLDRYDGDLRELAAAADRKPSRAADLLQQFQGIGPVGADIFLREVQDTWTWARPHFDERARKGATQLGLPTEPETLARLASGRTADLAAALVRITLDRDLAQAVLAAAE